MDIGMLENPVTCNSIPWSRRQILIQVVHRRRQLGLYLNPCPRPSSDERGKWVCLHESPNRGFYKT